MSVADRTVGKVFAKRAETEIYKLKKVSREFQVPYLAGYSKDRRTLYIDCDSLQGFKDKGTFVDTDKYLCIHEYVEDSCEDNGASYNLGHACATLAELGAVADDGVDVDAYNYFMDQEVRKAGARKSYTNLPKNLDLLPYISAPENRSLLKRMGLVL